MFDIVGWFVFVCCGCFFGWIGYTEIRCMTYIMGFSFVGLLWVVIPWCMATGVFYYAYMNAPFEIITKVST